MSRQLKSSIEDRGQRSEDRSQVTGDRSQKSEDGWQMSEDRDQITASRNIIIVQKTEDAELIEGGSGNSAVGKKI